MLRLRQEMIALLDALETDGDLDAARALYEERIRPLEGQGRELAAALTEMREMLFVHPNFSEGMRARPTGVSLALIRDELAEE